MRVVAQIDVSAPADTVWDFVVSPEKTLHFLHGVTRWEVIGDQREGMGARYRMLMRVGSAEVGSQVEIVEWSEQQDLAFSSITGMDVRGRWRLRTRGAGRTHVEFRLSYGVAGGGIGGWVAEQVAAPQVRRHLRRSLQQLKRQVEHEQLRRAAAERRSARVGAA